MITQQLQHDESLPCRLLRRNAQSKHFNTGRDRWNQMESAPVLCLSVYSGNFIPVSILCPLFTLLSLHLIFCSTSAPTPLVYILLLVISPCLLISSVFYPSRSVRPCSRWPPNWNISSANQGTKGKCYFEVISEGPGRAVGSSPASRAVSGIRLWTRQI